MKEKIVIEFENKSEIEAIPCEDSIISQRAKDYLKKIQEEVFTCLGSSEKLFKKE